MLLGKLRRFESAGSESLPLRQIFYAFISNHLQRNSELKSSAYGFAASVSIRQPPLPAVPLRAQPVCDRHLLAERGWLDRDEFAGDNHLLSRSSCDTI